MIDLNIRTPTYHVCQAKYGCAVLTNKRVSIDSHLRWYLCDFHRTETECDRLIGEKSDTHE
jgi:hypothetical protein